MSFKKYFFCFFLFSLFFLFEGQSFIEWDDEEDESVYFYNGIPGCECFLHCKCFSHFITDKVEGGFPGDTAYHPNFTSFKSMWLCMSVK